MSKQVDSKNIKAGDNKAKQTDSKAKVEQTQAKPAQAKPAQAQAPAQAKPAQAQAQAKPAQAATQAKPAQAATQGKAAPAPAQGKAAAVDPKAAKLATADKKDEAPQKSAIHTEIDKLVVDATKHFADKKTTKTEIVHDVKEIKITGDDKKTYTALVVYLPFVYVKNHRALISKIVNDIQTKKKLPTFVVSQRTLINKKADFKQKIPRNRTLTAVYDSLLEDLISPGVIIGKRLRFHLDGTQHAKIFLNQESKEFLESKLNLIAQIYKQLTNRKVSFEFRHETSYIKVPLLKIQRTKIAKKGAATATAGKKEAAQ